MNLRNFCIIAHIDHGKSTLADRFLEITSTLTPHEMKEQVLDDMDLERERGITIKARAVRMEYPYQGEIFTLNLIDTPGHVDFSYEVSKSLAACEGALLVVDAAQGVEAQTLSHLYLAQEHNLSIIPVINKIDLQESDIEKVKLELIDLDLNPDDALLVSAREGLGIEDLLHAIIERIPPPSEDGDRPLKALIFDSSYDPYRGVMAYIRVKEGHIHVSDTIKLFSREKEYPVLELGYLTPKRVPVNTLSCGEVGYLLTGIRDVGDCPVGDTVTDTRRRATKPLPGYKPVQPMVFSGLYPVDNNDYTTLGSALSRLKLNDSSLIFEREKAAGLGHGFRCGFLGRLHMEIIQERLEREYELHLIATAPSVIYRLHVKERGVLSIHNPALFPPSHEIEKIEEPMVKAKMYMPEEYIGTAMDLCKERRGHFVDMQYVNKERVRLLYQLPLSEIISHFFSQLKSRTKGYASLDYEHIGYQRADLVRVDILVNNEMIEALSIIVHREEAEKRGRLLLERIKEYIPRQFFVVPLQATIGGRIIARENVRAKKKDVLQKCYGGDITRKRKLLERQKEGKKRMKQVGQVQIPQEAFLAIIETDEE